MSFTNEKIVETKACQKCQVNFDITDKDLEFYDKVSPVFGGKKYLIPSSEICSNCSIQNKLTYRNDRNLYKTTCSFSGTDMISMYSPESNMKVIKSSLWWGDSWEALDYGKNFDFNRSFFEQFNELLKDTPHPNLIRLDDENADYSNYNGWNKNTYLCFCGNYLEDSMYCYNVEKSNYIMDSLNTTLCENGYELTHVENSNKLYFSYDSRDCRDSWFLDNCSGCSDCFMCFNQVNKQYCIENKQYSKQDYKQKMTELNLGDFSILRSQKQRFYELRKTYPKKYNHNKISENCSGDYIYESKDLVNCYGVTKQGENCKDVYVAFPGLKDSSRCTYSGEDSALLYEVIATGSDGYKCGFCNIVIAGSNNVYYGDFLTNCQHCFGCTGLKNKKYCIFNKQYTREEYEELVPKIIEKMIQDGEWGKFMLNKYSPFGYNETVAGQVFPLDKKQALEEGFAWSDYETPFPKVEKTIPADKLPDNIEDVPNDIFNWAITCEITNKPFRIIPQELEFYRKHNLPVPRVHPDQRHIDRMQRKNPHHLYDRQCGQCSVDLQTTYAPDRSEKILCEDCYNKEIY